jgi:hypothetical protein
MLSIATLNRMSGQNSFSRVFLACAGTEGSVSECSLSVTEFAAVRCIGEYR